MPQNPSIPTIESDYPVLDVKSFEHAFFARLPQTLPQLWTLEIHNKLPQEEKIGTAQNNIELLRLMTLILHDIHLNYAEQMLCCDQR
jgi:hypothetical protein